MSSDRLPPYDGEAEKAVLGSLLIDSDAITKVITLLNVEDFFIQQNQSIYDACLSVHDRNDTINQITVAQELARAGKLEDVGGVSYLSQLIATVPTSLHIESYAQIVARLSTMRKLISASDRIAAIGYEAEADVDDALSKAEDIIFNVQKQQERGGFISLRNILGQFFEESVAVPTDEDIPFIYTGFSFLDDLIVGLQRSALVVLGARTSIGKTSLALNIARNTAINQRASVALFSLEMSQQEVVQRFISSESGVSSKKIRTGSYSEGEERSIMDAVGVLSEAKIYIDDSSQLRVAEMRNKVYRLHSEIPVDLIIVDYLQLIKGETKSENRYQELSQITRALKALARDLNVPVLALSQLRRPEHHGAPPKPRLSDLRDSGSIEQDADVVIFIHREEKDQSMDNWLNVNEAEAPPREIADREPTDIIVAKNRNGPIGEGKLVFIARTTKFIDGMNSAAVQTRFTG